MKVTFRKVEDVEIAEVELLNGTVAAFLATDKEPESGKPWRERFGHEYGAFKKANEPKKSEVKAEAKPPVAPIVHHAPIPGPIPGPDFIPPPADHE